MPKQLTEIQKLIASAKQAERRAMGLERDPSVPRYLSVQRKGMRRGSKRKEWDEVKTKVLKCTTKPSVDEQAERVGKHGD